MEKYEQLFSKLEYLQSCAYSALNQSDLVASQHITQLNLNDYYMNHAKRFIRNGHAQPILVSNDLLTSYIDPLINVNFPSETYLKDPNGIVIFSSYIVGNSVFDICISTAHDTVFLTQFILRENIKVIEVCYVANMARNRYFK